MEQLFTTLSHAVEGSAVIALAASFVWGILSIILSLDRQGRAQLAWDLADEVYAWVIDFTRDIHPGDPFTVAFEYLTSSIGERRYGRILAASVHTARVERTAYVLSDDEGRNAYYDEDGNSLRRAFKMYPVRFRRISSGFNRSRFHPVLKTNRAHLGTDYAADVGTPIEATRTAR